MKDKELYLWAHPPKLILPHSKLFTEVIHLILIYSTLMKEGPGKGLTPNLTTIKSLGLSTLNHGLK